MLFVRNILLFVCLFICIGARAVATSSESSKFYDKHIIISVDQTGKTFKNPRTCPLLGEAIAALLRNEDIPSEVNITTLPRINYNPATDCIDLFVFGLWGTSNYYLSPFEKVERTVKDTSEGRVIFDTLCNYLVERYERITPGANVRFEELGGYKDIFNSNTLLCQRFLEYGGIGLSKFSQWAVIRQLDCQVPAKEYYIFTVSTFKSGLSASGDHEDDTRIKEIMHYQTDKINKFKAERDKFRSQYLEVLPMEMSVDEVVVKGAQIMLTSAINSNVGVSSNIHLTQTGVESQLFTLDSINISFPKDDGLILDKIYLKVTQGSELLYNTPAAGGWLNWLYNAATKEYVVPPMEICFDKVPEKDKDLLFTFTFTSSTDNSGDYPLLPFAFSVDRRVTSAGIDFVVPNEYYTLMGLALIVILLIWAYLELSSDYSLKVSCGRYSSRYSETTPAAGTVELPCWYVDEDSNSTQLRIKGRLKKRIPFLPSFIKGKLSVNITTAFLPDDFGIGINGNLIDNNQDFVPVELDKEGKFSFNLTLFVGAGADLSNAIRIQLPLMFCFTSKPNILRHKPKYVEILPTDADNGIDFFVHMNIGDTWVGIDPGTTGSCVAIGHAAGGTIQDPNISLVTSNDEAIIPSRLAFSKVINNVNSVDKLRPGAHYTYGAHTAGRWTLLCNNYDCFRSIKKLLGYDKVNGQGIAIIDKNKRPLPFTLSGADLAHLLVKGLISDTDSYLEERTPIERQRLMPDGTMRRAVVAIPNNYTLPKTLDMINSIARTGRFSEIRPVFEAEAVLFNYLARTLDRHPSGTSEVVAVYDMGGATINLSVFEIKYQQSYGNLTYHIETLGRIGYGVGGDNIDYALMQYIFDLTDMDEDDAYAYQKTNKHSILEQIFTLKKSLVKIAAKEGTEGFSSSKLLAQFVKNLTSYPMSEGEPLGYSERYSERALLDDVMNSEYMKEILDSVADAVSEILKYPDIKHRIIDKIIFSGRSTLFPRIKSTVNDVLSDHMGRVAEVDLLDATTTKTAVAYGACWYGMYNSLVTLDNSRLASAFGYKLTEGGKPVFHTLIPQNARFDSNEIEGKEEVVNTFAADGNMVEFYQVMGSSVADDVLDADNRHKVNRLGVISIDQATQMISIVVERSNMVSNSVELNTGQVKTVNVEAVNRDILEENSEAYIFAAVNERIYKEETN